MVRRLGAATGSPVSLISLEVKERRTPTSDGIFVKTKVGDLSDMFAGIANRADDHACLERVACGDGGDVRTAAQRVARVRRHDRRAHAGEDGAAEVHLDRGGDFRMGVCDFERVCVCEEDHGLCECGEDFCGASAGENDADVVYEWLEVWTVEK